MNSSHKHHLKLVLEAAMDKAIDESAKEITTMDGDEGVERVLKHLVRDLHKDHDDRMVYTTSCRHRTKLFNSLGGP